MSDEGRMLFDEEAQARRKLRIVMALAAAVVIVMALLQLGSTLDLKLLDTWASLRTDRAPSPQVVVVGMDAKSVNQWGAFPWDRDVYVPLIQKLQQAGAKVIGFDIAFSANTRDPEQTGMLAEAMQAAGNVVFGFIFTSVGDSSPPGAEPAGFVARNAVPSFDDTGMVLWPAPAFEQPQPELAEKAAALGHVFAKPDKDGKVRQIPLLLRHGKNTYPSLALQMARVYTDTAMDQVGVSAGTIEIGMMEVPIQPNGRILLNWTSSEPEFPTYSMVDVVRGDVPEDALRGKAVLVASLLEGVDERNFPFAPDAPGVLMHATFLDNFFKENYVREPGWGWIVELVLVLLFCGLSVFLLPRLPTRLWLIGVPALVAVLVIGSALLFTNQGIWFRPFYPSLALLLPLGAGLAIRLRQTEEVSRDVKAEKIETQKMLGLSFQEKGMLDMALATFEKLPMTDDMKVVYLNLGLDFENKGFKDKAFLTYKHVFDVDPGYEDVAMRMDNLRQAGVGTFAFQQTAAGFPTATTAPTAMPSTATAMPTGGMEGTPVPAAADTAINEEEATRGISSQPTTAGHTAHGTSAGTSAGTAAGTAAGTSAGAPAMPTAAGTNQMPVGQTAAPGAAGTVGAGATTGVGSQFGRYSIVKKLGRGAMGDVYLVRDDKIGRDAAMKTIRPDVELSPQQMIEMRQRFYREAQTAGKLTHANIVTIYDVGEEQGVSYIVMEFVEGDTLTNMRKKRPLTIPQIKHVIVNSALGLDFAHQNGVFHRDVKPDNIMISKTGVVKVMDFGIARLVESDMTRTGSVLGTPAYMSPEQFAGKKVDARSDIFSLAVVLYELLTRKRPFTGQTPTEVMFAIIQKEPPPPSEAREGVDSAWDNILIKAMAKDPAERYESAREFATAVKDCPAK